MACPQRLCTDENQIEMMQEALQDVGKWIFHVINAALQHNIPWQVITEGIYKSGAYMGYTEFPRTCDRQVLMDAWKESDFLKAHQIRVTEMDQDRFTVELNRMPVMEAARSCTDDAGFLKEFEVAYMAVFRGLFETYGYSVCMVEPRPEEEKRVLEVSRI